MTIPVPLGVRIYAPSTAVDVWVTKNVENLQFRSAAPGGFVDANFKFRRFTPIDQPDFVTWNPAVSTASTDNASFKVTDANAAAISVGDRFWVYNSGGTIRMNGDRFTVIAKSSSGGTTTVSYAPNSFSNIIASGDSVICKKSAAFYDASLTGFNKLITLFNKVQIVDLRTAEIVWEGRIENPARETDKDTWTVGCLGNTVYASDINRPIYYLSNSLEDWLPSNEHVATFAYSLESDSDNNVMRVRFLDDVFFSGDPNFALNTVDPLFIFNGPERTDMEGVGRIDVVADGNDTSTSSGKLGMTLQARNWDNTFPATPVNQLNIAQYLATGASGLAISKLVGTHIHESAKHLFLAAGEFSTNTSTLVDPEAATYVQWAQTRVQAQRMDRFGNYLNTGASYPNPALKVSQVIEDVIGRYLNNSWDRQFFDNPYPGNVNPNTAYVDNSSTVLMSDGWTFWEGATAKDILEKLMAEAQANAYWGIWESDYNNTNSFNQGKCRFSWETWPNSWGYMATSVDGLTEQPNGENEYNYLWYVWSYGSTEGSPNLKAPGGKHIQTYWTPFSTNFQGSDLDNAWTIRGQTVVRGSDLGVYPGDTFEESDQIIADASHPVNSGQIKIARPIQVIDKGLNGPFGMARTVDPWMIRPGKLMRVMDIMPATSMNDFSYGANLPNRGFDNSIFRMVETEYDSDNNVTTVGLDTPPTWYVPQQIVTRTKPGASFITAYR